MCATECHWHVCQSKASRAVLARRKFPPGFAEWNARHGAPGGSRTGLRIAHHGKWLGWHRQLTNGYRVKVPSWLIRLIGPFGFQSNAPTRGFEYPWCFFTMDASPGMKVVEIGAGASGLQFVLDRAGIKVTSVDPLVNPSEAVDWTFTSADFDRLQAAFGTHVTFVNDFIENVALPADHYDRVYSISVLEHLPPKAAETAMREAARILRPGGLFVGTVDLFLDCAPFSDKLTNNMGGNRSIKELVEASGLQLRTGDTSELCGYPDFEPRRILAKIPELVIYGRVLTQCFVLEKPRPSAM